MNMLEIKNLTKKFDKVTALSNLNLSVEQGSIFGFLGENGAGKTTTLKIVTGLSKSTCGKVHVCGEEVIFGKGKTNLSIGYLPDVPEFYGYMTPKEYLCLCGKLYGMSNLSVDKRVNELLCVVGLNDVDSNRKIKGFSRGMKQRLGIAQALIHNPELIILDEPTSALDPLGRKEILDIIKSLGKKHTIIFSTHILSDVEKVCDSIGVLHKGNMAIQGSVEDLKRTFSSSQSLKIALWEKDHMSALVEDLKSIGSIKEAKLQNDFIVVSGPDMSICSKDICSFISSKGVALKHFEVMERNLEEVFMEVIKNE